MSDSFAKYYIIKIYFMAGFFDHLIGGIATIGGGLLTALGGPVGAAVGSGVTSLGTDLWNQGNFAQQNAYNSPQAQMARYSAAGLNPNLIYSQMSNASPIVGATVTPTEPVQTGVQYANSKYTGDNLKQDLTDKKKHDLLVEAQTDLTGTQNDLSQQSLGQHYLNDATSTALDNAQKSAEIKKVTADTLATLDANTRSNALQQPNLQLAMLSILEKKQQLVNSSETADLIEQNIAHIKQDDQLKLIGNSDPDFLTLLSHMIRAYVPITP